MSTIALLAVDSIKRTRQQHRLPAADRRRGTPALDEALQVLTAQGCTFDKMMSNIVERDTALNSAFTNLPDPAVAKGIAAVRVTGTPREPVKDVSGRVRELFADKEPSDKSMKRPVVNGDMPTDHRSEVAELNREWRREMIDALKDVRVQIAHLTDTLTRIREEFAKSGDLKELEARIDLMERNYEKAQSKLIGGYFVMQIVVAIGVWLAAHYWK